MAKADTGYPQLIIVSSEQVRHSGKKTDRSVDGIFYDAQGRATAYQVFFEDKKATVVDAANVIHLKRFKYVNQKRGISSFAASLNSLRDTRDLMILEKKSIKVHSSLAATVQKKSGEVSGDGLFGRGTQKTTKPLPTGRRQTNQALEQAFAGAVVYLGESESVDLISSSRSTEGFLKFLELLMRDVCLNLSLSYEFVVNPTALSSAATRFIIQDADFLFRNLQHTIIDGALNRVYSWVVASMMKEGSIPQSNDQNWFSVSWVRPQSATIDQGRKDSAELAFVDAGLNSFDNFFSSRGKNWKEELRQVAIEKAYIKKLESDYGVSLSKDPEEKMTAA
jgi:capsid protein